MNNEPYYDDDEHIFLPNKITESKPQESDKKCECKKCGCKHMENCVKQCCKSKCMSRYT